MKRKVVWGKVKQSCYFSAKTILKLVSTKNKVRVSFWPVFHTASFSPTTKKTTFSILSNIFLGIYTHIIRMLSVF
jgi:hypothetical protein